jgi:DNA-binding phage protein
MEERKLIEFLDRLLAVLTARHNRKVLSDYGIETRQLYGTLNSEGLPKVRAFLEKRLPRSLAD